MFDTNVQNYNDWIEELSFHQKEDEKQIVCNYCDQKDMHQENKNSPE